ncbi:hypothetical protein JCM16303_001050, partial [Sporobolomyces ruberrimus]
LFVRIQTEEEGTDWLLLGLLGVTPRIFTSLQRRTQITKHVSALVQTWYPAIYERYKNADPGKKDKAHPHRCRFGIFSLFCFNYSSPDAPVHCVAHADWKNTAGGVCILMPYGDFNSKLKHYLLFNDLGVALEVPAGVAVVYPSSLLMHENCNLPTLVQAGSKEEALEGKGTERGSLVWFTQANFTILGELGKSLGEFAKSPVCGDLRRFFVPPTPVAK